MATYNEIIYNIKNLYSGGRTTQSSDLSNEQVLFIFDYYRAFYTKKKFEEEKKISQNLKQTFCMRIKCASLVECCDIKYDKNVMRTVDKLPSNMDLIGQPILTFVGNATGSKGYSFKEEIRYRWKSRLFNKSKEVIAWIRNDYLYFDGLDSNQEFVTVTGIFQNPAEVEKLKCTNSIEVVGNCFTGDETYPLDIDLVPVIMEKLARNELRIYLGTNPYDVQTDTLSKDRGIGQ